MAEDDAASIISWSGASETDRLVFTALSNADRLDVERLPRVINNTTPRIEELPPIHEESMPSLNVEDLVNQMSQDAPAPAPLEAPPVGAFEPLRYDEDPARVEPDAARPSVQDAVPPIEPETTSASVQETPLENERPNRAETTPRSDEPPPRSEEDALLEKQSVLYDLQQLETRGARLSRRWSLSLIHI